MAWRSQGGTLNFTGGGQILWPLTQAESQVYYLLQCILMYIIDTTIEPILKDQPISITMLVFLDTVSGNGFHNNDILQCTCRSFCGKCVVVIIRWHHLICYKKMVSGDRWTVAAEQVKPIVSLKWFSEASFGGYNRYTEMSALQDSAIAEFRARQCGIARNYLIWHGKLRKGQLNVIGEIFLFWAQNFQFWSMQNFNFLSVEFWAVCLEHHCSFWVQTLHFLIVEFCKISSI